VNIDTTPERGARVAARLRDELVAWLVTVEPDGTPVPTPVWFWWDGEMLSRRGASAPNARRGGRR
jgi:hypothetical protein